MKPWLLMMLLAACSAPEYDGEPVFTSTPISTPTPSPTLTPSPTPNVLTFSENLITRGCTITLGQNGSISFSKECGDTMDEKSRTFWKQITAAFPSMKMEICR